MSNLFSRLSGAAIIVLALASNAASADDYPSKSVRLIVPFPPGGSNDVVGRLVAQQLSAQLGQQVFVDNRGSAGGVVGAEIAATSAPDGYTLLVVSIPFAVDPALHKLNYDPIKSFEPIALLATGPDVLVVNPAVPVKSVKELIELAKQKPGQLNYASAGIGTFTHLAGALFTQLAGVNIVHVPYRGGGPAIQDVLAGHVGIMFSSLISDRTLHQNWTIAAVRNRRQRAKSCSARCAHDRRGRRARLCGCKLVGHSCSGRHTQTDFEKTLRRYSGRANVG